MTKQELLDAAMALPEDDRVDLALELWERIDHEKIPLSQELKEELERRLAEEEANPSPSEDWETLREKLLRGEF